MRLSAPLALALGLAALARPAHTQSGQTPPWTGEFAVFSGNVLLGGIAAGVAQKARGGSFSDGFTRGAGAGAGIYAGKRIAAARWTGAGLVGRQVASVGSSVVYNAGQGRPSFEQIALPLGPVRFYVRPRGGGPRVHARVDAVALATLTYAATRPELEWDEGRTLSSGGAVFRAPRHTFSGNGESAHGLSLSGAVLLGAVLPTGDDDGLFAHERVHTLQTDQLFLAIGRPLQDWVSGRSTAARKISRWMDVDFAVPLLELITLGVEEHDHRPWELESYQLSGVR
jgi:hypothetical protein